MLEFKIKLFGITFVLKLMISFIGNNCVQKSRHCSPLINWVYCLRCLAEWSRHDFKDSSKWIKRRRKKGLPSQCTAGTKKTKIIKIVCNGKMQCKITTVKRRGALPYLSIQFWSESDSGRYTFSAVQCLLLSTIADFRFLRSNLVKSKARPAKLVFIPLLSLFSFYVLFLFLFFCAYFHVHLSETGCLHFTSLETP